MALVAVLFLYRTFRSRFRRMRAVQCMSMDDREAHTFSVIPPAPSVWHHGGGFRGRVGWRRVFVVVLRHV